ncbi:MAG: hypothetical protein CMJ64_10090 [Planctomycetaceae bacterium]|nr:hypothetical protein [Planctomycetaceae bacterium]
MLHATLLTCVLFAGVPDQQEVLVVVGSPGTEEYGAMFEDWAERWSEAAKQAKAAQRLIGIDKADETDRTRLQTALKEIRAESAEPLWIVLIGHGTFDGKAAKFNLRGLDVTAVELAEWLLPLDRPVIVANCASASAPFINKLSGLNRVIVSATKNGFQYNFARFGDLLSQAIIDPQADLDKDEQVSILEAFLSASGRTQEFYTDEGRLATEHALIDDNGDGKGTPADWYRGVRTTRVAKEGASPDGLRANQLCLVRSKREENMPAGVRNKRDEIERSIALLRLGKKKLPEAQYYTRLEPLLIELAKLYEALESQAAEE